MDIVRGLAIFCEDIREEKSGQDTLIGIMADNLALPSTPVVLGRLSIYMRVYFDTISKPEPVIAIVQMPWGERFELGGADEAAVADALAAAKFNKAPLAGVILKGTFAPLAIPSVGVITASVKIGTREHVLGALNIAIDPAASVSAPHS